METEIGSPEQEDVRVKHETSDTQTRTRDHLDPENLVLWVHQLPKVTLPTC